MGVKKLFGKLWRFFKKVAVGMFGKSALNKLIAAARAMLKTKLGKVAWAVVRELEAGNLTNSQKKGAAFKRIKQAAKDGGIEVKDSLLNLLIEMAVARLKGVVPKT
ncbi:hypothetical protein LCGC14_0928320 [marine sediment metagenome]|uniref:Uncharacterized protein n=1 Tax=marine sediment metagenome TaxID=412755 RepID=A0A0F9P9L7_9ZZZZ